MTISILCAAILAAGAFSIEPLDGGARVVLSSSRPAESNEDVRCRWMFYKDAIPAAAGLWDVSGLGFGASITNSAPEIFRDLKTRGGDLALRVRFVTGDPEPSKETLLGVGQVDYPRQSVRHLPKFSGEPPVLSETVSDYVFTLPSTVIRFDRSTGLLSGFATGWWSKTEWMKRPMVFDFGDPAPRIRLETFSKPVETNGVWTFRTVSWWTLGEGSAKTNFELRVSTDWQVRGDGRVVSKTVVRPFGLRHILPRVGWAFVLEPPDPLVQYYGAGPAADSADRSHEGVTGLYESSVRGCGSHELTRAVSFDAGSDHLAFSTLGGNFSLEVGETPSKGTFCGLVFARQTETDRDWYLNVLISPEKTLLAMSVPDPPMAEGTK